MIGVRPWLFCPPDEYEGVGVSEITEGFVRFDLRLLAPKLRRLLIIISSGVWQSADLQLPTSKLTLLCGDDLTDDRQDDDEDDDDDDD